MKKYRIILILALALLPSCTDIVEDLASLHLDLQKLKKSASELNVQVEALKQAVNSISVNFITEVKEIVDEEGRLAGYSLIYKDGSTVDLPFGIDGTNGYDGRDGRDGNEGNSPVVGVKQDTDGFYYWTLDDEWMLDSKGAKIPICADGITPQMKVENGFWMASFDNGITWKILYRATATVSSIFKDIDYKTNYEYIVLTLKNGTVLQLPREIQLEVTWPEKTFYSLRVGDKLSIPYSIEGGKGDASVSAVPTGGLEYTIVRTDGNSGNVIVSATQDFTDGKVVVFLRKHNRTFMKTFTFTVSYEGLSANGMANCYMVSTSGTYRFYAGVKGCGPDRLDGTPCEAQVLWESLGTSAAVSVGSLIKSVRLKNGYVEFTTAPSFSEGNAVIAVTDAGGTILWSWHIWLVSYEPDSEYAVYESHQDRHLMTRNLGSLSSADDDPKGMGLFYQWGRKDPFPGPASFTDWQTWVSTTAIRPDPVVSGEITGSADYAIKNPMTIITRNDNYYGWNCYNDSFWAQSKSISDPCPPGWQVPVRDDRWYEINKNATYDRDRHYAVLPSPYSVPESHFPLTGYIYVSRNYVSFNSLGSGIYLWCALENNESNRYDEWAPLFNDLNRGGWGSGMKSYAVPVRCISQ